MKTIDLAAVQERIHDGRTVLLEVLPRPYYDQGHLPGAVQVTNEEIGQLAPSLVPDRDRPVVVYCASATCANSHRAHDVLRALGYTDVAVFVGGKAAWKEAGLPFADQRV